MMNYNVIRSKRKTIAIEINRTGEVIIRVPYRMPNYAIKDFIKQKQDWIDKHIEKSKDSLSKMKQIEPLTDEMIDELFSRAKIDIPKRVSYYSHIMGVDYGRITIRCQKTRWGSCSAKGNLNFNFLLMLAPSDIIDYVVIHELAHRKCMNHSVDFWKTVESIMPDYKNKRKWLREYGNELMYRVAIA